MAGTRGGAELSLDLRAYLELDELPLVVVDVHGSVAFANRAARRQWQLDRGDLATSALGLGRVEWSRLRGKLEHEEGLVAWSGSVALETARLSRDADPQLFVLRSRDRRASGGVFDRERGELRDPAQAARDLEAENARLAARNRRLTAELGRDELTGVASRRALFRTLAHELRALRREEAGLGLLMVDVDHFKRFNDAEGHVAGDRCLVSVAAALKGSARRARDLVARYGGEEFAVVLPGVDAESLHRIAEQARGNVAAGEIRHPDSPLGDHVTVSVGAAWFAPGGRVAPRDALDRADRALYAAKVAGRNRVGVAGTGA